MAKHTRKNEVLLIVGFLAVLFAVPAWQIALEARRGERVQFTDLFRYAPSQRNLRQFESTLEDRSWFQQAVRPGMREVLLRVLQDPGPKAVMGLDDWVFYRPGVRYLIEPDAPETPGGASRWVRPGAGATRRQSVVRAIVQYRDQLQARDIRLLVVPVPGKASVYPDMLTRRARGKQAEFRSPTLDLLADLDRQGVQAVDLFAVFRDARRAAPLPPGDDGLYLARDTHWTPAGAALAAEAVANKLRALGWAPNHRREYLTRTMRVRRHGDVIEMIQAPGARDRFGGQVVHCRQVLDSVCGPMVPFPGGPEGTYANQHLVDTPLHPAVLVLGDSYCRIYQLREPQSLGEALDASEPPSAGRNREGLPPTKRLLPGSAGFPSLLALCLQAPVDYIASDGGAATDVRRRLSVNREILERKRVVVWEFAERDIALGAEGWRTVPLPPEL